MDQTQNVGDEQHARGGAVFLWDDVIPQLARRIRGSSQSWIVQTRVQGKTVRRRLECGVDDPLEAVRAMARDKLAGLADARNTPAASTTLATFAPRFLEECKHRWKPATQRAHGKSMNKHVLPYLGRHRLADLQQSDVVAWRTTLETSTGLAPASINRAMAVLSAMMQHAEIHALRPADSNPCKGLRKRQSAFKSIYLDKAGYAALGTLLARKANQYPRATPFIRFLLLTGCRRSEAEQALWSHLDGDRLALPDAKAGPRSIWLGKPARAILAGLPQSGGGIFTGGDTKGLRKEINTLWQEVRDELKLPTLRLHDLRHSFASVAVNNGLNLQVIGGLLGHADMDSTAGYAHLDVDVVKNASQRVGIHLARALSPSKRGRPKRLTGTPQPHHFQAFTDASISLHGFCQHHRLDTAAFLKGLKAWQKANQQPTTALEAGQ